MPNDVDDLNQWNQREDLGWLRLRNQLDIEMPQKKKRRGLLWLIFFLGIGTGLAWLWFGSDSSSQLFQQSAPIPDQPLKELQQKIQTLDSIHQKQIEIAAEIGAQGLEQEIKKQVANELQELSTSQTKISHQPVGNVAPGIGYVAKTNSVQNGSRNESKDLSNRTSEKIRHQSDESFSIHDSENIALKSGANNSTANTPNEYKPTEENKKIITFYAKPLDRRFQELKFDRELGMFISTPALIASITPIQMASKKVPSGNWSLYSGFELFPDTRLRPTNSRTGQLGLGFQQPLSKKWYLMAQAGVFHQWNRSSYQVNANGFRLESNGNANKNASLDAGQMFANSQNIGTVQHVLFDASRNITALQGDTLYISNADQVSISSNNRWGYSLRLYSGYYLSSKWFVEGGVDMRNEWGKPAEQIQVSISSQAAVSNAGRYTLAANRTSDHQAPRFSLGINTGYEFSKHWSVTGGFMSGSIMRSSTGTNPNSAPTTSLPQTGQSFLKAITIPGTATPYSFNFSLRYRF
jgi:hypothetical protein